MDDRARVLDVGACIHADKHALVLADKSLMFVKNLLFIVDHPLVLVNGCGLPIQ